MNIELNVFNPNGDHETSFDSFVFSHVGCGVLNKNRNPITSEYTLRCSCGIEIRFLRYEDAYKYIVSSVIDGNSIQLPNDSYSAHPTSSVRVIPQKTP